MVLENFPRPGESDVSSGNAEGSNDTMKQHNNIDDYVLIHKFLTGVLDAEIYVNSSEKLAWNCLRVSVGFIRLIDNPTEEMWDFVVNKDPKYVDYVPKEFRGCSWYNSAREKLGYHSEREQQLLVSEDYRNVFEIKNPTKNVLIYVVQEGGRKILDEMVTRGLVEKDGDLYGELEGIIHEGQDLERLIKLKSQL